MGPAVTTVLLDTHVLQWWSAEPARMSPAATRAIAEASTLAVAAISWFELAWLARHDRIRVAVPVRAWLHELANDVQTIGITPEIADAAVSLPPAFPGDPADRLIYATAVEFGWRLVTKDLRLRAYPHPRPLAVW